MENPSFHLDNIISADNGYSDFDGPLSLILMLLARNKIEIKDISISLILDQYLEYIEQMQNMNLEVASEFVQMASHLLYLKTNMMLSDNKDNDEFQELVNSLERLKSREIYSSLNGVFNDMYDMYDAGTKRFSKLPEPDPSSGKKYEYDIKQIDLFRALFSVMSRSSSPFPDDALKSAVPRQNTYSLNSVCRKILDTFSAGDSSFNGLFRSFSCREEAVAGFLCLLELCSLGYLTFDNGDNDYIMHYSGTDSESILSIFNE